MDDQAKQIEDLRNGQHAQQREIRELRRQLDAAPATQGQMRELLAKMDRLITILAPASHRLTQNITATAGGSELAPQVSEITAETSHQS